MIFKAVKKELIDQNLMIKDLAESIGYSKEHISGVINGRHDSPKVKKMISLVLGKDFDALWSSDAATESINPT